MKYTLIVVMLIVSITTVLAQLKPGLTVVVSSYNSVTDSITTVLIHYDEFIDNEKFQSEDWEITGGVVVLQNDTIEICGDDPERPFTANGLEDWTLIGLYNQLKNEETTN